MASPYRDPLNLGQDRLISINTLADLVAQAAGMVVTKRHVPGPQGVRGRNSNNDRLRQVLGWEPQVSLEEGIARTYRSIEARVAESLGLREVEHAGACFPPTIHSQRRPPR